MAKLTMSLFLLHLAFFFCASPSSSQATTYNVLDFGASADGKTDSSPSFLAAWASACGSSLPSTIYVPKGTFLVSQATFAGSCGNKAITFSIDGTIVAPSDYVNYGSSGEWIAFQNVDGVSIVGGTLDGRGQALWDCKLAGRSCPDGASSLTFMDSKNIVINGLTSVNSKLFHIVILHSESVNVSAVKISAAENSPNTDGIHVQASTAVNIVQAQISTGDDCISIGPSTTNLSIEWIFCGPGHGISIGSLGKRQGLREESVRNVMVKTAVFSGTTNGVRIKTWASTTPGHVSGVTFQDLVMQNVQNPIIIDQNYCPGNQGCPRQNSGIKISEVKYANIQGTSATEVAVNFDCSPSNPCSGIRLRDIKLSFQDSVAKSSCTYANGITSGIVNPPSCL